MVASAEVVRAQPEARARAELGFGEQATSVQLAGRDPHWMAEGAKFVEGQGAKVIDINMGCPSKRVTTGLCGSALLRDLDLALTLIEAVVKAVKVPVTLKTRLGWDDTLHNAPELAKRAEGRGADDHHPRPHPLPVLQGPRQLGRDPRGERGRDDPRHRQRRHHRYRDGAGSAPPFGRRRRHDRPRCAGRPLETCRRSPTTFTARPRRRIPEGGALGRMILDHYEDMLTFYGRDLGLRMARKHLGWYLEEAGLPHAREAILTSTDPAEVIQLLEQAFAELELAA
jgi:tRNA-dihydrouridine synthase B